MKDVVNNLATEVYKDAVSPAVHEVGLVAGRSVRALLAPIRGFLWGWERIEEYVERAVQERLEKTPEERRKTPDPEIAVPLIQSLTYTAQNETLREMYIALLANSMDKDKEKVVHPSYVEIIKKMNRLDALLFERLTSVQGYVKAINPRIVVGDSSQYLVDVLPEWYIGWKIEGYDEFDISASLVRMSKFGIIDLMFHETVQNSSYNDLLHSPYLDKVLKRYKDIMNNDILRVNSVRSVIYVNEYGRQFRDACQ